MDGKYLSDSYPFTDVHKELIEKWVREGIKNKVWEEDLDLHVDEICKDGRYNKRGKHKKYWISISISLAYHANKFLQETNQTDIIGVVVMPLYSNEKEKMGFPFNKIEDVKVGFDLTPPSLYLTSKKSKDTIKEYQAYAKKLGIILIDDSQFDVLVYEKLWITDCINHIRQISLVPSHHSIKLSK